MLIPGYKLSIYFLRTSRNGLNPGMPFYAVSRGRKSGVFKTWEECKEQVKGYSGAKYKKFNTMAEARSFVSDLNDAASSGYSSSVTTDTGYSSSMTTDTGYSSSMTTDTGYSSSVTTDTGSLRGNKLPSKRMRVEEEKEDGSVVIENKNAFHHLDHVPAVIVEDPDHIIVEGVTFSSQEPERIFSSQGPERIFSSQEPERIFSSRGPEQIFEPRSFFVVIEGRKKGIYRSVAEAWNEIDGYPNSFVRTFKDEDDARFFLENHKAREDSRSFLENYKAREDSRSFLEKRSPPPVERNSAITITEKKRSPPPVERNGAIKHVHVWTDGACECNGKGRAAGGIGVYWGQGDPRNISEPLLGRQTNNRAEVHAAIRAVREAKRQGYGCVTIHTDSLFLINSITKWVPGWIRRGWTLASGGPVVNKEDFLQLLDAMNGIDVKWEKVLAHSGDEGNEQADRLAREGIHKPLVSASWDTPSSLTALRN